MLSIEEPARKRKSTSSTPLRPTPNPLLDRVEDPGLDMKEFAEHEHVGAALKPSVCDSSLLFWLDLNLE